MSAWTVSWRNDTKSRSFPVFLLLWLSPMLAIPASAPAPALALMTALLSPRSHGYGIATPAHTESILAMGQQQHAFRRLAYMILAPGGVLAKALERITVYKDVGFERFELPSMHP